LPERKDNGFFPHVNREICGDILEIPLGGAYALEIPDRRAGIADIANTYHH